MSAEQRRTEQPSEPHDTRDLYNTIYYSIILLRVLYSSKLLIRIGLATDFYQTSTAIITVTYTDIVLLSLLTLSYSIRST